jgi:hypothetical protein
MQTVIRVAENRLPTAGVHASADSGSTFGLRQAARRRIDRSGLAYPTMSQPLRDFWSSIDCEYPQNFISEA